MVPESQIVNFVKVKIRQHQQNTGKAFRVNSLIGCFNRDKAKRKWFMDRYPTESTYMQFIHKHKRDFVYDKATGNITVNKNPCPKPPSLNEMVSGTLIQLKESCNQIEIAVKILEYLQQNSGEKDVVTDRMKCKGEAGVKIEDLLNAVRPFVSETLKAVDSELETKFQKYCCEDNTIKTFIKYNKKKDLVTLNAFDAQRHFKETYADEAIEAIKETANDIIISAIKELLAIDQSPTGKWKTMVEICKYLNCNFKKLAPIACNLESFDEDELNSIIDESDYCDDFLRDEDLEKIALKSRINNKPRKSNEVLLYEKRGETLREIRGNVKIVNDFKITIVAEVDELSVDFQADMSTGEHIAVDINVGDQVDFNARYDAFQRKWNAMKIISVERSTSGMI